MWKSTFLNLPKFQVNGLNFVLKRNVVEVNDFQFLALSDDGNIAIVQVDDFICIFDDRGGI